VDTEYLRQEGKRALKKQEAERLRLRILGLVNTIRNCLDPTEKDPARLKTDIAAAEAFELDKLRTDYLALAGEISEIDSYLGRR
jgi:hypothetical protein